MKMVYDGKDGENGDFVNRTEEAKSLVEERKPFHRLWQKVPVERCTDRNVQLL